MTKFQQPSKECVRNWLRARIEQRRPPPDAAQIRRELGWGCTGHLAGVQSGTGADGGR